MGLLFRILSVRLRGGYLFTICVVISGYCFLFVSEYMIEKEGRLGRRFFILRYLVLVSSFCLVGCSFLGGFY